MQRTVIITGALLDSRDYIESRRSDLCLHSQIGGEQSRYSGRPWTRTEERGPEFRERYSKNQVCDRICGQADHGEETGKTAITRPREAELLESPLIQSPSSIIHSPTLATTFVRAQTPIVDRLSYLTACSME